ncbi:hypothetical protein TrST_g9368 [Triparma strigata]|uniref:Uncharacterized protein n=1 Tax=Triparma strigata TaxID=1606541 RepID=A0A9W7EZS4_9STRA|nr:hypothetical protein TrST_g9368 [Triparma strigata]
MSIRGRKFIDFLRYNVPFLSGSTSAPIHKTSYWDAIYQDSFVFEWGVQPKILGDELMGLQKGPTCVLGAGTSVLGSELAQRGFKPLVQCDFSPEIVKKREKEDVPFKLADATKTEDLKSLLAFLEVKQFQNIVDKGLIDGLYLGGETSSLLISDVISSCSHVLTPNTGTLSFVSFSPPKHMVPLLGKNAPLAFKIDCREIADPPIYLYEMRVREEKRRRTVHQKHQDKTRKRNQKRR